MSNDNNRRYGLIGAGMMGQEHIKSLAFVEGADLVAIAEPNDVPMNWTFETLRSSRFKPALYSDWREMVASADLDAIIIATPNFTHHEILVELMGTDLAIMVEKPMCTTLKDAKEIAKLAGKRAALTHVGLEYRYMPPVAKFIEDLHSGKAGSARMMTIREHRFPFLSKIGDWNRFNEKTGGTLVEKCCHFFDLMRLALKDEPVRIFASAGMDVNHLDESYDARQPDILDNAMVIVDFVGGARAHLDLCMFAEGAEQQEDISVIGDVGKLEVQIPSGTVTWSPRDRSGAVKQHVGVDADVLAAGHHHGATVYHLRDFHDALVNGKPAPVSAYDGLRSVEMGLAAQKSAASGKAVSL